MWNQPVSGTGQENYGYSNLQYTQDPQTGYVYIVDPASGNYVVYDPTSSLMYEPATGSYYYFNAGTGQVIPYTGPNVQGQYNYPVDIGQQADIYQTEPVTGSDNTGTPECTSTIPPSTNSGAYQTEIPPQNLIPQSNTGSGSTGTTPSSSATRLLLVIAEKDYQEDELSGVRQVLDQSGIGYDIVSSRSGLAAGMSGGSIQVDKSINQVTDTDVDSYSGLVIIGGEGSMEYLWNNKDLLNLVQHF